MSQSRNQLAAEYHAVKHRPIEYLTENGFSIVRLSDIDESITAGGAKHSFVVRDPRGYEMEIAVDISDSAVAEIIGRSSGRVSLDSSYWIYCAERHLADYVWENDDYPPEARLLVHVLTLDDLDLARRWEATEQNCGRNLGRRPISTFKNV
jgi:hypothetical protein